MQKSDELDKFIKNSVNNNTLEYKPKKKNKRKEQIMRCLAFFIAGAISFGAISTIYKGVSKKITENNSINTINNYIDNLANLDLDGDTMMIEAKKDIGYGDNHKVYYDVKIFADTIINTSPTYFHATLYTIYDDLLNNYGKATANNYMDDILLELHSRLNELDPVLQIRLNDVSDFDDLLRLMNMTEDEYLEFAKNQTIKYASAIKEEAKEEKGKTL